MCENIFLCYHLKRFFKKHPDLKWERTAEFHLEQPFATLMNATVEKLLNQMEDMDWSVKKGNKSKSKTQRSQQIDN